MSHPNHALFLASTLSEPRLHESGFDWNHDLNERLVWLYGSAIQRRAKNERDEIAWRQLGRPERAA